ncbi:MAG: hypothetical protein ACOX6U_10955 [Oscillospiraceae bacterium]
MSAQTKKQIIIAVILAAVAIAAVLIFLFTGRGDTIDKYVFAFEGEEHTGKVYTTDDITLALNNGEELPMTFIVYLQDKQEYQFGTSVPEEERLKTEEPYQFEIVNAETGEIVGSKPIFIAGSRNGRYYYRIIFRDTPIDVEASPDLKMVVRDLDGNEVASQVIVTAKTLFTEADWDSLKKLQGTVDSSSSDSSSSAESSSAA